MLGLGVCTFPEGSMGVTAEKRLPDLLYRFAVLQVTPSSVRLAALGISHIYEQNREYRRVRIFADAFQP